MISMNLKLKQYQGYTFLSITQYPGIATRTEINIINYSPCGGYYKYRQAGKKKVHDLFEAGEIDQWLFFEGHDLPFILETEVNAGRLLGVFNFVSSSPGELRIYIKRYLLNPSVDKFRKMLFTPWEEKDASEPQSRFLFPECHQQGKLPFYQKLIDRR
jgi:hypothetical protein